MIGYPTPSPYYTGTDREFGANVKVGGQVLAAIGSATAPAYSFGPDTDTGIFSTADSLKFSTGGTQRAAIDGGNGGRIICYQIAFDPTSADVLLQRDAADTLALRRSTNAQALRIYNTYTDGSNYERLSIDWSSNIAYIRTANAGTGVNRDLVVGTSGVGTLYLISSSGNRWQIPTAGHLLASTDNTYDIGASGATRPRSIYVGTNVTVSGQILAADGTQAAPGYALLNATAAGFYKEPGQAHWLWASASVDVAGFKVAGGKRFILTSDSQLQWNSAVNLVSGSADVILARDAAGVLALRNSTNAQTFRFYNTYTDGSNYEMGDLTWVGNRLYLRTTKAGTGSSRGFTFESASDLTIAVNGISRWNIDTSGNINAQGANLNIWNGTSALATNATAGFLGVNSCAGTPSGTPASIPTGQIPLVYDSSNDKLYAYRGGTWRSVTFA